MNNAAIYRRTEVKFGDNPWDEETDCNNNGLIGHDSPVGSNWPSSFDMADKPAPRTDVLINAIKTFGTRAGHPFLIARVGAVRSPKQQYVTIARSDYEALVSRITALEEKAGILSRSQQDKIANELAVAVASLANEAFNIENATCHAIESDGEPCLLVSVHVGAESAPEEMSDRKTKLHQMVIKNYSPSPRLRIKVVYG
jgi:hypothetical protein